MWHIPKYWCRSAKLTSAYLSKSEKVEIQSLLLQSNYMVTYRPFHWRETKSALPYIWTSGLVESGIPVLQQCTWALQSIQWSYNHFGEQGKQLLTTLSRATFFISPTAIPILLTFPTAAYFNSRLLTWHTSDTYSPLIISLGSIHLCCPPTGNHVGNSTLEFY